MGPGAQGGTAQILTPLITVAILAVVLWRRNSRPRQLRIERLWIRPLLFALIVSATLAATPFPFDPLSLAVLTLALVLGGGLGWQRGRFMQIDVHAERSGRTIATCRTTYLTVPRERVGK